MSQDKSDFVIYAEGVKKVYDDKGVPVHALRGIDLRIKKGEFTAIMGPSGSGKTTFINVTAGLDKATDGKVWLSGQLLNDMDSKSLSAFRRDNIGFIFQSDNLIPVLTVEENVEYIMLLQGVPKEERHKRVLKILEQLGLKDLAHRRPTKLSGGQQQRVGVARAMVARPSLVLADEPTASLDSEAAEGLMNLMRDLNEKENMTFLFSTHDPRVMDKARRIVILKDGKIDDDKQQG